MNFVDLLENYLILKERDKDLYYDIKDNIDKYKSFIYDNLAYDIIIKDDFIKLEKIPGIPEESMGISEFTEIKEENENEWFYHYCSGSSTFSICYDKSCYYK